MSGADSAGNHPLIRGKFKSEFMEDYFEKEEYQQEMAFDTRINKALRGLK